MAETPLLGIKHPRFTFSKGEKDTKNLRKICRTATSNAECRQTDANNSMGVHCATTFASGPGKVVCNGEWPLK